MPAPLGGELALAEGAMLNEFFTEMVEVIFIRGGMLDKYMGDGLMAIFGAPVLGSADADNALCVATDMVRALGIFNNRRGEHGFEPIEIGIGLATGEVLAGSVGATKRMEYTAIGGNVNLMARLESANKFYGTVVLLAESTVNALKSPAVLRRLDLTQAKGILQPTWVHESLGYHTPVTFPRLGALIKAYEAGLDAIKDASGKAVSPASAKRSSWLCTIAHPASVFDRCRYYQAHPPEEAWDGVWIMEQK